MSCRKASRELLERFRFGEELDASADPHLAHLQACAACRAEVGLDLSLISQLRRALQLRVEGYAPSPGAWQMVRAQLAAPAGPTWAERLVRWVRLAPAGAAMVLMLAAVVTAQEEARPRVAQPQTWPSVLAAIPAADEEEVPWYIAMRPAPPVSPPATGPIAWVDPRDGDDIRPAPQSVSGIMP